MFGAKWMVHLPHAGDSRLLAILDHYSRVLPTKWIPEPLIDDLFPYCNGDLEILKRRGIVRRTTQRKTSGQPVVCWRRAKPKGDNVRST